VSKKWVLNASPIISLAKISHAHLFESLSSDLVIPAGVAKEVSQGARSMEIDQPRVSPVALRSVCSFCRRLAVHMLKSNIQR
jgi:predicted nucleic acid-binding protein